MKNSCITIYEKLHLNHQKSLVINYQKSIKSSENKILLENNKTKQTLLTCPEPYKIVKYFVEKKMYVLTNQENYSQVLGPALKLKFHPITPHWRVILIYANEIIVPVNIFDQWNINTTSILHSSSSIWICIQS